MALSGRTTASNLRQFTAHHHQPAWSRQTLLACILLIGLTIAPAAFAQRVVVNPSVPVQTLDKSTLRAIMSMRLHAWGDGKPIRVFVLGDKNPLHQRFTREVLGLYPHRLRRAWDRLVYAGIGQAPTEVSDEQEMRQMVATTPGAIGYLEKDMIDDSVREITVE